MFIYDKNETLAREQMQALQLKRLQNTVQHTYDNVPMYRKRFDSIGMKPGDIKSLKDLEKIPFTVKEDLRQNYPFGMFAVHKDEVVRLHASSGTTGQPTVVGYTKDDLETWSDVLARLIAATGVTKSDVVQIAFGYGLFTGAFGFHYALEKLGCTVIPASSGNTEKQLMIMKDFGTTVLVATPSYAMYIAETALRMGIDPKRDLNLRIGLFGAESSSPGLMQKIGDTLGLMATDNYGMSELIGPGVSGECVHRCGMHINEDHFIPEIINPDTGEVLPEGSEGELVITCITKQALPILRYRTKDITSLNYEKCECGRTTVRMAKVMGRSDDMLIIRGVNVFPSQIETVLMGVEEVGPHYEIIVTRKNYMDNLEIKVELIDDSLLDNFAQLEGLTNKIKAKLRTMLGLDAKILLAEPLTLKRFEGKAKRVTDLRDMED